MNFNKTLSENATQSPKLARFETCRKGAEGGNAEAMCDLGQRMQEGEGVRKNPRAAFAWFKKAAATGLARGQRCLGLAYRYGLGVEQNMKISFELFQEAAKQGDFEAMFRLGAAYDLGGRGAGRNTALALFWYRKATRGGHSMAMNNLGLMYENGKGVPQDEKQARELYRKSADAGCILGQSNFFNYLKGHRKDAEYLNHTEERYKQAARKDNPVAKQMVIWLEFLNQ